MTVSKVGDYQIALSIAMKNLYTAANNALPVELAASKLGLIITSSFGLLGIFNGNKKVAEMRRVTGSWVVSAGDKTAFAHHAFEALNFVKTGDSTSNMHITKA